MELFIYGVYDGDKMVFRGTSKEIAERYNVKRASMPSYTTRGTKLKGLYTVMQIDTENRKVRYNVVRSRRKMYVEPIRELNYEDNPFECLVWHLRKYGNTSVVFDPSKYVKDLNELGISVLIKEIPDDIRDDKEKPTKQRKHKSVHWYVETVDAKGKRTSI